MKYAFVLIAAIVIAGCVTSSGTMEQQIGKNEIALIVAWGAPDSQIELTDGRKVYTWKREWYLDGNAHTGKQTVIVSKEGIVEDWADENMPPFMIDLPY